MHIYHYGAYDVSALRRLSTRHDTRQDEVDALLRAEMFVDLYRVLRRGLYVGEEDYSLKSVERLYRPGRFTDVTTALDSMVQYAHWMGSQEGRRWENSRILKGIRNYNEDDCESTAELLGWLRTVAVENRISYSPPTAGNLSSDSAEKELPPGVIARQEAIANRVIRSRRRWRISLTFIVARKSRCGGECLIGRKPVREIFGMTRVACKVLKLPAHQRPKNGLGYKLTDSIPLKNASSQPMARLKSCSLTTLMQH